MIEREVRIRTWYCDTDQMGIVHHRNYLAYFEAARGQMLRELGLTYREMEERGVMMPVVDVRLHYRAPARYDELLRIVVRVERMPKARMEFFYHVYAPTGELLTEGSTVLGFMHAATRRPCRAPAWLCEVLRGAGLTEE